MGRQWLRAQGLESDRPGEKYQLYLLLDVWLSESYFTSLMLLI